MWISRVDLRRKSKPRWKGNFLLNLSLKLSSAVEQQHSEERDIEKHCKTSRRYCDQLRWKHHEFVLDWIWWKGNALSPLFSLQWHTLSIEVESFLCSCSQQPLSQHTLAWVVGQLETRIREIYDRIFQTKCKVWHFLQQQRKLVLSPLDSGHTCWQKGSSRPLRQSFALLSAWGTAY